MSSRLYNRVENGTKICTKCEECKPVKDYYKIGTRGNKVSSWCKVCIKEQTKQYRLDNVDKKKISSRRYNLMRTYGLTEHQYDELLKKQNYCCAVCGKHETEENRRLAVDHNHKTGEIRGLLCNYCNHRIVGKWTDGDLLRRVADYIEQSTGWIVPPKPRRRKIKTR